MNKKCYFLNISKLIKIIFLFILYLQPLISPSLPEYPFIRYIEYEKIFQRSKNSALFGRPLLFDRLCDNRIDLVSLSPSALVPCDTACISVLEPQYFGGIQNERRPFSFVRGCASDIFELAIATSGNIGVPAEIEYLHRAQACIELPIGRIWPLLGGVDNNNRELVRVCSCGTDECNNHDDVNSAELSGTIKNNYLNILLFFVFVIIFLN
ncbi:unnamed protein product [Meloidogyne enterolobii]|uniref:Uncharacterized protein n=1 Tax=Meloidogyne enterolobii TaxID=390850 RepID=A0ACB0XQM7_MELEN